MHVISSQTLGTSRPGAPRGRAPGSSELVVAALYWALGCGGAVVDAPAEPEPLDDTEMSGQTDAPGETSAPGETEPLVIWWDEPRGTVLAAPPPPLTLRDGFVEAARAPSWIIDVLGTEARRGRGGHIFSISETDEGRVCLEWTVSGERLQSAPFVRESRRLREAYRLSVESSPLVFFDPETQQSASYPQMEVQLEGPEVFERRSESEPFVRAEQMRCYEAVGVVGGDDERAIVVPTVGRMVRAYHDSAARHWYRTAAGCGAALSSSPPKSAPGCAEPTTLARESG